MIQLLAFDVGRLSSIRTYLQLCMLMLLMGPAYFHVSVRITSQPQAGKKDLDITYLTDLGLAPIQMLQ
jgi:hypothetical protein